MDPPGAVPGSSADPPGAVPESSGPSAAAPGSATDPPGAMPASPPESRPPPRAGVLTRETSEFARGLSFFDAIYAFAITLLVVNIDVPPTEAWRSLATLTVTGLPRQVGGFALSFIVIAVFWRINVRLVQRISAMDPATTMANLVAAALVVLIPFTTQGISDPGSAPYALPTVLYAGNIALASLAQMTMFEVARRRGLERAPLSPKEHRAWLVPGLVTPAVFLASVPVALVWGGDVGKLFWLALAVLSPLAGRVGRRPA